MSAEQNKTLTLGSLFDGSGGFPLGGLLTGQITPVWSSEIEPFAIRATTKRLPQVKHYGDVSAISGADLPPVDIITFGSPCQDMSIAGKRDGLDGSRSSLFYEAIRIVKEMRCKTNGEKPRFIVWENVPGAFSSNKGQDFKAVLEAVIGVKEPSASVPAPEKKGWPDADYYVGDGWSVAYRVLDKDLRQLEKSVGENDEDNSNLDLFSLEMFEDLAWLMARHADPAKVPDSPEEFLDQFNTFSIYQILPQLIELWGLNVQTEVESRKNLEKVSGK